MISKTEGNTLARYPNGGSGSGRDRRPPQPAYCGDLDIRIDRDGVWHHGGETILREDIVCLFAHMLSRDSQGDYWLTTPTEYGRIRVDDVPFLAVEMFVGKSGGDQTISFRTNVDHLIELGPEHGLRVDIDAETGEPRPYVRLGDTMEARLTRSVYYELVEHGTLAEVDGRPVYGVWSGGRFFVLGSLEDDGT